MQKSVGDAPDHEWTCVGGPSNGWRADVHGAYSVRGQVHGTCRYCGRNWWTWVCDGGFDDCEGCYRRDGGFWIPRDCTGFTICGTCGGTGVIIGADPCGRGQERVTLLL